MINESLFFAFFNFLFLHFCLLLFLDLVHVILSLYSSLFTKTRLFFCELFLSGDFEISLNSLSFGLFKSLSFSSLSFTFFKCSFGSQSINFSLSISSFFLQFSKSLNFSFFFILDSLSFKLCLIFSLIFCLLMSDYFIFRSFIFRGSFFFLNRRLLICFGSLSH